MIIKRYSRILIFFFFLTYLGCVKTRNHPGYNYIPDMAYSSAYETFSENPNYKNSNSFEGFPKGTVSRSSIPYQYSKSDEDRALAGLHLVDTIISDSVGLNRGKYEYQIFCLQCHGEKGDGNGPLYFSGRYPYKPSSLVSEKILNNPDGEVYHVITVGYGIMGAHGPQVRPEDRWNIINYIKSGLN